MKTIINSFLIFGFFLFVLSPQQSFAYFDPGTGSYIIQIVAATLFAGLFIIKTGWRQIKDFLSGLFKRDGKKTSKKQPDEE